MSCETEGSRNRKETRIGWRQSERGQQKRTAGSKSGRGAEEAGAKGRSDGDGEGGRDERHPSMAMQREESDRQTDSSSFGGRERQGTRANFKL